MHVSALWWLAVPAVLALLAIGATIGGTQRRRARAYSRQSARHVLGDPVGWPVQDFYGSMNLEDELEALWPAPTRYGMVQKGDWREQTAADLSPEALAVAVWAGPPGQVIDVGYLSLPAELQQALEDSGPGDLTSLDPGPDPTRLSWLDDTLTEFYEWVRRMRPEVTGWALT